MQRWIRVLSLAVVVLATTACGQGTTSTTHSGSGAARGTPTTLSSSPTAAATVAVPPPDAAGQYHNLTFAQAQQLAPFPLTQPTWVPAYLQAARITASVPNITEVQPNPPLAGVQPTPPAAPGTPPTGPVQVVSLTFGVPYPGEFAVAINELKQGTPLGPATGQDTPGSTTTTITIAGHSVTRTTWAISSAYPTMGPDAAYVWSAEGTTFQFLALTEAPVTEQDVEHMIASMLQPATSATPWVATPSPTPAVPSPDTSGWYHNLTFAQAQRVALYHLARPTWVPAYLGAGAISATTWNSTQVQPQPPATEPSATGPVQVVVLTYFGPPSDYEPWVFIGELKPGTPLGRALEPTPVPSATTSTTLTIAGHLVTRTTWGFVNPPTAPQEGVNAIYVWTDQGTTFQLTAFVDTPLTEQDVEHMIASMLG